MRCLMIAELLLLCTAISATTSQTYSWCDCGTGLRSLTVWPDGEQNQTITTGQQSVHWASSTDTINLVCDGMTTAQSITIEQSSADWVAISPHACLPSVSASVQSLAVCLIADNFSLFAW